MKVSALIPTYSRRPYVCREIDSVLAQTVPVDEITVLDDGSTDGTVEAIHSRYGSRVAVFRQENRGVSAARKRAVEMAQGEWVAFLDSDDEWLPERNAAFLKTVSNISPKVAWIFGDTRYVTDQGEGSTVFGDGGLPVNGDLQIFSDHLSGLVWNHGRTRPVAIQSSFIRKSALVELKCFNEGFHHAEDFLAMLQIASRYFFAAIPSVVTRLYRTSDLDESSLERNAWISGDHYRAGIIGYALVAQTLGPILGASFMRIPCGALCKWHAQNGLPIRRLAWQQFKFCASARSIPFYPVLLWRHAWSFLFPNGICHKAQIESPRRERVKLRAESLRVD